MAQMDLESNHNSEAPTSPAPESSAAVAILPSKCNGCWPACYWTGALGLAYFFGEAAFSAIQVPFFVEEVLGQGKELVACALTAQYIASGFGNFLTGMLADYVGPKWVLLVMMVANAVLLNVQGLVSSGAMFVLVRALMGCVSCYAVSLTWVATTVPSSFLPKAMSRSLCFAQLIVTTMSFVAGSIDGRQLAIASAILSMVPTITALWLMLSQAPAVEAKAIRGILKALWATVKAKQFQALALIVFLHGCFFAFLMVFGPGLLTENFHERQLVVSLLFIVGGAVTVICHATVSPLVACHAPVLGPMAIYTAIAVLLAILSTFGMHREWLAYAIIILTYMLQFAALVSQNVMVVVAAKQFGPAAIGAANGFVRALYTLGMGVSPMATVALKSATGAWAVPCAVFAAIWLSACMFLWCGGVQNLCRAAEPKGDAAKEVNASA